MCKRALISNGKLNGNGNAVVAENAIFDRVCLRVLLDYDLLTRATSLRPTYDYDLRDYEAIPNWSMTMKMKTGNTS